MVTVPPGTAPSATDGQALRTPGTRGALASARSPDTRGRIRTDIQAMRAVAVCCVLVYHLWPTVLPGGYVGVDVFFVVSGFLITGQLLAARPRGLRAVAEFWVRRIRRLMPAAVLVLASTLVAFRFLGPDARWQHTALETIASALNVENWALRTRGVDYLAAGRMPSPVQHYWSLSVEEQFYAIWPLLIAATLLGARLLRRSDRAGVLCGFVAVAVGSFVRSVERTPAGPAAAFFSTDLRVWELAAGALLAAWSWNRPARADADPSRPRTARTAVAWIGSASILAAAVCFDDSTEFPGYAALVPVLGAVALLAARDTASITGRALAARPVQYLGDISYSLYLWHWPVLVLWSYAMTNSTMTILDRVGIAAVAVILAALTNRYVENRFRTERRCEPMRGAIWKPLVAAGVAVSTIVGLCLTQIAQVEHREKLDEARVVAALADPCFGAGFELHIGACPVRDDRHPVPSTLGAFEDRPPGIRTGCAVSPPYPVPTCVYGVPGAGVRIALVGNSHASQWLPALQTLAETNRWQVTTFTAVGCSATSIPYPLDTAAESRRCLEWGRLVQRATMGAVFDLVVVSSLTAGPDHGRTSPPEFHAFLAEQQAGYETYLRSWATGGTRVLVLRDTPFPRATGVSVPECLGMRSSPADCDGPRSAWVRPDPLFDAALRIGRGSVTTADLTDAFCGAGRCPAVIGGAIVYFDGSHMTTTFAKTLAPALLPRVRDALAAAAPP